MAINTNKRIPVKWIRDKAKGAYQKADHCFICGATQELELHHLHSITYLLEVWTKRLGIDISTDEAIISVRDRFIAEHHSELYDLVYTLCNKHHVMLHGVYGKSPGPSTVSKQQRWILLQQAKFSGDSSVVAPAKTSHFAQFTGVGNGTRKIS